MSPDTIFRDAAARQAALKAYARAHDRLAEEEQRLAGKGRQVLAQGAHEYGLYALRAWIAEQDDPEPREMTDV